MLRSLRVALTRSEYEKIVTALPRKTARSWLWPYLQNEEPLQDLIQEVYVGLLAVTDVTLQRFNGVDAIHRYGHRIARNVAVDWWRRRETSFADAEAFDDERCRDPTQDPMRSVAAHEELEILAHAIRRLPRKCREAFIKVRVREYTVKEAALILNISEYTVKTHLQLAMQQFAKDLLEGDRPEEHESLLAKLGKGLRRVLATKLSRRHGLQQEDSP